MNRQIQTALGPIDAERLGTTLAHEHVLISAGGLKEQFPFLFDYRRTLERVVYELKSAKDGGIDSLIELTTVDLGRDVSFYAEASRRSGVNVIVTTGFWLNVPIIFRDRSPDFFANLFVHEIEHGIEGTGIRPGVIKISNDIGGVTPEAEAIIRGAARACKKTGIPISTHQWATERVGKRQLDILLSEGVEPTSVCIGHSADTTDIEYLIELLRAGVFLSMDRYPGREGRPDWRTRNATVKQLVDRGFASQLMLGHDYAPGPIVIGEEATAEEPTRYLFLSTTAIPALCKSGVSEATIRTMMVDTPRRFLCGRGQ